MMTLTGSRWPGEPMTSRHLFWLCQYWVVHYFFFPFYCILVFPQSLLPIPLFSPKSGACDCSGKLCLCFFFGYTFAGWMHLVVSSVCVLMVIAVAARALMILFIFLCGSWWKPLKNTGSLFFSTWACILIKEWTL